VKKKVPSSEVMEYDQREQIKRDFWPVVGDPQQPLEVRKEALLLVIRSHFERSLEGWPSRGPRHGSWREYVQSWLFANGDRRDVVPPEVAESLRQEFPAPAQPMIDPGKSYWRRRKSDTSADTGGAKS
jgi:hypothetical protein